MQGEFHMSQVEFRAFICEHIDFDRLYEESINDVLRLDEFVAELKMRFYFTPVLLFYLIRKSASIQNLKTFSLPFFVVNSIKYMHISVLYWRSTVALFRTSCLRVSLTCLLSRSAFL